jgi:hypothetical protein
VNEELGFHSFLPMILGMEKEWVNAGRAYAHASVVRRTTSVNIEKE